MCVCPSRTNLTRTHYLYISKAHQSMFIMRLSSYLAFIFVAYCTSVTLAARCPITGPLLPSPKTLSTSPFVLDAGRRLKELLDSALTGSIEAGWQTNVTSFSIILTDTGEVPLWEYHHTASGNVNSTKNVDGDTQFMIASITKAFTDLALLKAGLNLDDPITKYLPELASSTSPIKWKDITLRALGNHMAGIPQTCRFIYNIRLEHRG
jgi:CubicO group peptidase (beta-lactamase class C family)